MVSPQSLEFFYELCQHISDSGLIILNENRGEILHRVMQFTITVDDIIYAFKDLDMVNDLIPSDL